MKRFLAREDGIASLEFSLMFPIVMGIFMMSAEMGSIQLRQAMLERSMDIVVRDLRLGKPEYRDPIVLKQAVCDEALLLGDCMDNMKLEMGPVKTRGFSYWEGNGDCVERNQVSNPVINFTSGSKNEIMLIRFCYLHDPIFPAIGLGAILPPVVNGGYRMMASTFFVNEPT
ncbi:TadE/TadG family type IV pilus assembly protein [Oceaniglobus ichthyenteri]|uniref:TadE/TadG family type IV pilus assembly protein n=1 Tax=Oceaniglobus ichthyenteri TaxID=2136177 RepID=UPI000D385240|nr:pilus assembly protein TadE [Oceaniglobus ichthyenteri]